ncbi:hypothetical protein AGABI1DRAFT_122246 [Agaricus bisporus var. burnettii JB137-S8]|uniref:acylaminoacyl-peptidase n=1 Tax=Agaricus bisporus var. burnettii (strain JB137-S8 / ATCC MYA-4627 / FGSC 10392) TaxID=597362 RepID=K5WPI7_AGABU|nr:uncharacterized protein AGABI1DRAFT_122246 [Agaricus bisporus var. burnettii JB137-S8]EKM77251.1 hypothetical protein AGABI1DRAFT_122246 [Agaricus bisporus var. burnettii JB137-S8]
MYTQLAEIPTPVAAAFLNDDAIQISYTSRNHVSNTKKTLTKVVALNTHVPTKSPLQEVGEIVASVISPSYDLRADLRERKEGTLTKRFLEIWVKNRMDFCFEVTDFHREFYLDDYLSTLAFSPSETALLYTAEGNSPTNTTDDPYAQFRYKPSFGEGFGGKRQPRLFLLRWRGPQNANMNNNTPPKPQLFEIKLAFDNVLFGQGVFFPNAEENVIYATGYEYTSNGRLLGIKGCFNRPFGIWELQFEESDMESEEKKRDLVVFSARKISDKKSGRSPRVLVEDSKVTLYWLSSDAGGPHISTTAILSTEVTRTNAPTEIRPHIRSVVPTIPVANSIDFPGLYPPFNLCSSPFLQLEAFPSRLIIQSQWGSRTTILSISVLDGSIKDITPPDSALFSWTLLTTDGKSRIICSRSSPAVPYEVLLGVVSDNNNIQWSVVDEPDLAIDVYSALQTIRTSVHQIPDRWPLETIVVRSTRQESQGPLITAPHGGPHVGSTTSFSAATTALALEGYTFSQPNYTGTTGYGQDNVYKLLGKCGTLDVEDVHASTLFLINDLQLARLGEGEIFVWGGSHGGFIAAHLISRFPDIYSAAVLRNPVITCGEIAGTDIPDWYFAEFGFQDEYPIESSFPQEIRDDRALAPHVTPRIFGELYAASPSTALVNYLEKRQQNSGGSKRIPPVLLCIGASDQRVSPTQGFGFYHLLKGAGETVEVLVFDGEGHPIDGVEASKVAWEAGRDWLKRFGRKGI